MLLRLSLSTIKSAGRRSRDFLGAEKTALKLNLHPGSCGGTCRVPEKGSWFQGEVPVVGKFSSGCELVPNPIASAPWSCDMNAFSSQNLSEVSSVAYPSDVERRS